jgi:hypothetical protein
MNKKPVSVKNKWQKVAEILIHGFTIIDQILAEDMVHELKCFKYLTNFYLSLSLSHTQVHHLCPWCVILVNTTHVWGKPDFRTDKTQVGNSIVQRLGEPKFALSCALNTQRYQMFISASTKSAAIHTATWLLKHELL